MGVGFILMVPLATTIPDSAPLLGITGVMFVFTIAELLLSPVGLSLSTKLAPAAYQTQMVALFFLSVALGTALSGQLARFFSEADQVPYFAILGGVAIVIGVVLALLTPWLQAPHGRGPGKPPRGLAAHPAAWSSARLAAQARMSRRSMAAAIRSGKTSGVQAKAGTPSAARAAAARGRTPARPRRSSASRTTTTTPASRSRSTRPASRRGRRPRRGR